MGVKQWGLRVCCYGAVVVKERIAPEASVVWPPGAVVAANPLLVAAENPAGTDTLPLGVEMVSLPVFLDLVTLSDCMSTPLRETARSDMEAGVVSVGGLTRGTT